MFIPHRYNRLVGKITSLISKLTLLTADNQTRIQNTRILIDKLYNMGLITTASLEKAEKLSVSALCRRRLAVMMVKLKFAETLKQAVSYVEQGNIRVGPHIITDPAFLVTRAMEDWMTWAPGSAMQRAVLDYNDKADDYDLLNL